MQNMRTCCKTQEKQQKRNRQNGECGICRIICGRSAREKKRKKRKIGKGGFVMRQGWLWVTWINSISLGRGWGLSKSNWLSRMQLFCLQLEASCLQLSFFACTCFWEHFLLTIWALLLTIGVFLLTDEVFFTYSGKIHLISTYKDCKQRSSTLTLKTLTSLN